MMKRFDLQKCAGSSFFCAEVEVSAEQNWKYRVFVGENSENVVATWRKKGEDRVLPTKDEAKTEDWFVVCRDDFMKWGLVTNYLCDVTDLTKITEFVTAFAALTSPDRFGIELPRLLKEFFSQVNLRNSKPKILCEEVVSKLENVTTKEEGLTRALAYFQAMSDFPGGIEFVGMHAIFKESRMNSIRSGYYSPEIVSELFAAFSKHRRQLAGTQRTWCLTFIEMIKTEKNRRELFDWVREARDFEDKFELAEVEIAMRLDKKVLPKLCASFEIGHHLFQKLPSIEDQKYCYSELPKALEFVAYRKLLQKASADSFTREWATYLAHFGPSLFDDCFSFRHPVLSKLDPAEVLMRLPLEKLPLRQFEAISEDVVKRIKEKHNGESSEYSRQLLALMSNQALSESQVRSLHAHMPLNDSGSSFRIRQLAKAEAPKLVLDLEVTKLVEIVKKLDPGDCQEFTSYILDHKLLVGKGRVNVARVFSAAWMRVYAHISGPKPDQFSNAEQIGHDIYPFLDNDGATSFISGLLSVEPKSLPVPFDVAERVIAAAMALSDKLQKGAIPLSTLEIFESRKVLFPRLMGLCPTLSRDVLMNLREMVDQAQSAWRPLLVSLKSMVARPRFEKAAAAVYDEHVKLDKQNRARLVKDWTAPQVGSHLCKVSELLTNSLESEFFVAFWDEVQKSNGKEIPEGTSVDELAKAWVEEVNNRVACWQKFIEAIKDETLTCDVTHNMLSRFILTDRLEGMLVQMGGAGEVQLRATAAQYTKASRSELEGLLSHELGLAAKVLRVECKDQSISVDLLATAVDMFRFIPDAVALRKIAQSSGCPVGPSHSLAKFCTLLECGGADIPIRLAIGSFAEFYRGSDAVQNIIPGYPRLYLQVMAEEKLLELLASNRDIQALNQRIDIKQGDDIQDTDGTLLSALRAAAPLFLLREGEALFDPNRKTEVTFEYLLRYVSLTCSSIAHLSTLRGNVASVTSLLKHGGEERQIIADVKAILSNGSFRLDVSQGVVSLSASMILEKQQRTISAAEFETLPSQLLLTSGVVTSDSISDEDADRPLPPNISNTQDREVYVMRFIKVHDVLANIANSIETLSNAGHPDFQQKTMTIPGEVRVSVLRKVATKQEAVLRKWLAAFETYRTRHPILSMLSRRQLVACLSALRQQPPGPLLHHVLVSIGCPLERLTALADNVGKDAGSDKATELVAIVARLLEDYLAPEQWASKPWNLPVAQLPNVTTDLGIYKLITVPGVFCPSSPQATPISAPLLEEVVLGMYIARHSRFPTPAEWLVATPGTSCLDIEDFLCRWYNWQTLAHPSGDHMANIPQPWEGCKATFVILQVSELSYAVQTHFVWKLRELVKALTPRANGLCAPLLLLSSAASGSYFVANALAKDEAVLQAGVVQELRNLVAPALSKAEIPVRVAHSKTSGAGKTYSVLQATSVQDAPHIQLSVDVTPLEQVLGHLNAARPLVVGRKTVVHFNLGHRGDAREISAALIQYIFVGCWRDKMGFVHPRHPEDTIILELPNTGLADERDRFSFTKHFPVIPLVAGISLKVFVPELYGGPDSILYKFQAEEHKSWVLGAKILCALKHSIDAKLTILPRYCEVPGMATPNAAQIMSALDTVMPKLEDEDVAQKRRAFQFAATQLANFYHAFSYWGVELGDDFYRHVAFHYAMLIVDTAFNLSAPSMEPLSPAFQEDDVKRCLGMTQFDAWREKPYVICSTSSFAAVSLDEKFDILEHMAQRETKFKADLLQEAAFLRPYNRERLHDLCLRLREKYKSDHLSPAIAQIARLMGGDQTVNVVLSAMETLSEQKLTGTESVEQISAKYSSVRNAVEFLNNTEIPGAKPMNYQKAMVSDLKRAAEKYVQSLTWKNPDDPSSAFTITVDIILRLIAIHLRLLSGVPVVLMGETGCGKTETLRFFAGVSGNEFEVINVQEGMTEEHFYDRLKPVIARAALLAPLGKYVVVMLDEVNATSYLWVAKDIMCDKIVYGHRLPANLAFVAIMNPWKLRTEEQRHAIESMDVGGLDFSKYNKQASTTEQFQLQLVYHIHRAPETLYSLVWDFGYSANIKTPLSSSLRTSLSRNIRLRSDVRTVTDELLLATHMVDSICNQIQFIPGLLEDFTNAGDSTGGTQYFVCLRTVLVELLLDSQRYLRQDVYSGEVSVVSLRDMRRACDLVILVLCKFYEVRAQLDPKILEQPFAYFHALSVAVHIALVVTYCLRLDSAHRLSYLVRIHNKWGVERSEFKSLNPSFLPAPAVEPVHYETSTLYESFDEFATFVVSSMTIERGIAVNQALKENTFGMLAAVCTKSTLFIVGRPGSTKSRALQLLCASSQARAGFEKTFLGCLQLSIQKFVIQCSPDTTSLHVNQQALRAANAQLVHIKGKVNTSVVLVFEEVGATIGSAHNPLMSLHGMIDYGVEVARPEGKKFVRNPIIGISNYRLDASKMGRGRVIYRGNPTDLEKTAHHILVSAGDAGQKAQWVSDFASAFSNNILLDDSIAWYHGMRDFYATITTVKCLSRSRLAELAGTRAPASEIHAHTVRWALLINLRGLPEPEKEKKLYQAMLSSFTSVEQDIVSTAVCEWQEDATNKIRLCDVCLRMKFNVALLQANLSPDLDPAEQLQIERQIFHERCKPLQGAQYPCERFLHSKDDEIPAPEIVAYSLREYAARHIMVFTKANAALKLLRSLKLIRDDRVIAVFHSPKLSTSELARDMMRVKAALREGRTLILVRSRHLYEALLDALNVSYMKEETSEGTLHRTMLSMAGVTQSVFVRPSFRCIVVEDQDEAQSCLLPPFMNRFSKVTLTYGSALNRDQGTMRDQILAGAELRVGEGSLNLLSLLIPGYTSHTLDSVAYEIETKDTGMLRYRMGICFSHKALRRLELGLIEGLPPVEVNMLLSSWKRARGNCLDFTEVIQELVSPDDDQKADNSQTSHVMVFTEQIEIDPRELVKMLGKGFEEEGEHIQLLPNTPLQLNQANINDLQLALNQLRAGLLAENEVGLCICTLDVTSGATGKSMSFEGFTYAVSQIPFGARRHVVLIVIVDELIKSKEQLSLDKNNQFQLIFERNWIQLYADEVVPIDPHLGDLGSLEKPLGEVLNEELISQLLIRDDNLVWISQLTTPMSTHIRDTKELLYNVFSSPSLARAAICSILQEGLKSVSNSVEEWTRLALSSARSSSFSLRSIYLEFLSAVVARSFLVFAPELMSFGNLKLALDPDVVTQELFATLCRDQLIVPRKDCSKCVRVNQFPVIEYRPIEIGEDLTFDPRCEVTVPFAPYLAKALHFVTLEEPVPMRYKGALSRRLLENYASDVFSLGLGLPLRCVGFATQLITRYKKLPLEEAVDVHIMLTENRAWVQALKLLVVVPSPLALEAFRTVGDYGPIAIYHLFAHGGVVPLRHVDNVEILCDQSPAIPWNAAKASALALTHLTQENKEETKGCEFLEMTMQKFFESPIQGLQKVLYDVSGQSFAKYFLFEMFASNKPECVNWLIQLLNEFPVNMELSAQVQCSIGFLLRKALKYEVFEACQPTDLFQCIENFASNLPFYNLVVHSVVDVLRSPNHIIQAFSFLERRPSCILAHGALISGLMLICETLLSPIVSTKKTVSINELALLLERSLSGTSDTLRNYALMFVLRQFSCGGSGDMDEALRLVRSPMIPESIRAHRKIDDFIRSRQPVSALAAIPDFSLALDELCNLNSNKPDLTKFLQFPAPARAAAIGAALLSVDLPRAVPQPLPIAQLIVGLPEGSRKLVQALAQPQPQLVAWKVELRRLFLHLNVEMDYSVCEVVKIFQRLAEQTVLHAKNLRQFQKEVEEALVPRCPRCRHAFVDWTGCFAVYCGCGCGFCGYCLQDCGTDAHGHIAQVHHLPMHAEFAVFNRNFGAVAKENIRQILRRVPVDQLPLFSQHVARVLRGNPYFITEADFYVEPPRPGAHYAPATVEWMGALAAVAQARVRVLDPKADGPDWTEITKQLSDSLTNANQLLFPGVTSLTSITKWIHATVVFVFHNNVGQVAPDRERLGALVSEHLLRHEQGALLLQLDQRCEQKTSELNRELTFSEEFQTSLSPQMREEARAFLYRSRLYEEQLIDHIKHRNDFKVLNRVIALEDSLEPKVIENALKVATYVGLLHDSAEADGISRAEAKEEGSLMKLIRAHPKLTEDLAQFQDAFKYLFPLVTVWQCGRTDIQKAYAHFKEGITEQAPLACLLAAESGPGILPCAMYAGKGEADWQGLALAHNALVMEIHGMKDVRGKALNPYKLVPTDLAAINLNEMTSLVLDLFTVPGHKPTFSEDLAILESQCIYGPPRWHKYRRIADELPHHAYGVDNLHSFFARVQQNLQKLHRPFELLSAPQYNTLQGILAQNGQLAEAIFDYCALLFIVLDGLLSAEVPSVIPVFVSELKIDSPLTKSQRRGQAILTQDAPVFSQTLKLTQIPCLMGMCWNRTADVGAKVPLANVEAEDVRKTLKELLNHPTFRLDIPLLLSSMRLLGVAVLSNELTGAFLESPLLQSLQYSAAYEVPFLDDDAKNDQFVDSPPFTTPLRHFQAVFDLMEKELGAAEAEIMRAETEANTFSVAFATVRHLLVGALPQDGKESKTTDHSVTKGPAEKEHTVSFHVNNGGGPSKAPPPPPPLPVANDADEPDWDISGTLEL